MKKKMQMDRVCLFLAMAAATLPVAFLVNRIVPHPYMDEIFHIPQAQQYCQGNFKEWDPMITTFPGLYYISILFNTALFPAFKMIGLVSTLPDLCSPPLLRSVNIGLAILCSFLFRSIIIQLKPNIGVRMASQQAFVLALYPLHWFFTFLFYTDVGSTAAVMAMYLACLKKAYWTSGLFGIAAILFRQTNVVWTAFVTFVGVKNYLQEQESDVLLNRKHKPVSPAKERVCGINLHASVAQMRRQQHIDSKLSSGFSTSRMHISSVVTDSSMNCKSRGSFEEMLLLIKLAWNTKWSLICRFSPLLMAIIVFMVFVIYNGGIVLGAKEAHKVSPHFSQFMYFAAASSIALAPIHYNPDWMLALFKYTMRKRRMHLLSFIIATLVCVHFFSLDHPYLLADNRHYTFYIWRKVINAHCSTKYILAPIYVYAWYSIVTALGRREEELWILVVLFGTAVTLVPAPLVELRYYTIPFYLIALHTPILQSDEKHVWLFIVIEYTLVNILTMYVFLFKPFIWPDTTGLQRFIW